MPNTPNVQDKLSQNGHYLSSQGLSEELLTSDNPDRTALPPGASESEPLGDEWSSLTKELIDTLPRVGTRGLLYLLVVFAGIVLPWAMLFKVDETGSARGRLEPQGKTLRLDAPVAGIVAAIKAKEGQTVKEGQTLLELESEIPRTELQQAQAKLKNLVDQSNTLERVKNNLQTEQLAQLDQIQQQLNSSQKIYTLGKPRLTAAQKDLPLYKKLWQQRVIGKSELEEKENALFERQRQLEQTELDKRKARTELEKQQSVYQRQLEEYELRSGGVRSEIAQIRSQIKSLEIQLGQREFKAPETGTVFQLPIQRAGAMVQPGTSVAEIAPQGSPLVLRALIPTSESGSLQKGLPVKLKFDAYPFQDYGVVEGKLIEISPTTSQLETPNGKVAAYNLEIALNQHCILIASKCTLLRPGDTATAEVIVRQRRIIDFLLDPFKKLQQSGLKL